MKAKYIIFSILYLLIISFVSAQIDKSQLQIKDYPQTRIDFEILRTKDPKTGKIPKDIRMKELKFMRAQQKNLGIPLASGDIYTNWSNRGPHNVGGRTRALAVDVDNENIILAGGVSGGMWRSTDGGTSWSKTTRSDELQSVSCIAQDLRNGHTSTWYYGTGELTVGALHTGEGIYKSTDNGLTWTILSATSTNEPKTLNKPFDYNHEIAVNPVNGHVLVANYGGIHRSTDGGTSFSQVIANGTGWTDVLISSTGFSYATIDNQGVFSSPDGVTWTNISPPPADYPLVTGERKELALAASNENILYVLGEDASNRTSSGHNLWHFDERTDTWTDRSAAIPQLEGLTGNFNSYSGYSLLIKVKPDDENFVIIAGLNLFRSTNGFADTNNTDWIGGFTVSNNSFGFYRNHHPDQHAFVFLPGNRSLSGNDGGVYITNDITDTILNGGETVDWRSLNNGYLTTQTYAISAGPGEQIMAGFHDRGTWFTTSTSGTTNWTYQLGGDGGYSAINSDGTIRFLSYHYGNIHRHNYNEGANDIVANNGTKFDPSGYSGIFITPFYLDPQNDNLFYLGGNADFYVNTQANTGSSSVGWKSISLPGIFWHSYVSEIGVTMSNLVYVGTSGGQVYKVTDPGNTTASVSEITGTNFSSGYVSGIAVNPFNSNKILVTFSNYSIPSVFYSDNGGTSWTDVSGNLEENPDGKGRGPSVRTTAIAGNGNRYFVGTSTGLYSTTSLSGSSTFWTQEDSNGIGDVVVEHVISRASDGLVVAGTYGNGIYSAKFEIPAVDLEVTEITAPNSGILSATESITATIANRGSADQTGFTISLIINGNDIMSDVINSTLMVGASASYTFSHTFDFSELRDYTIEVRVIQPGDANTGDDSFTKTITSILRISSFPYSESFETANNEWYTLGTLWELGTPAGSGIIGASDGTQAWATDLDADYPNDALEMLESPVFDFSSLSSPIVSFDINCATEEYYDGLYLAYRTDLNNPYTPVPLDAGIENWYNSTINGRFGSPVWGSTTYGNYINANASFTSLKNQSVVQLALIFSSDYTTQDEGIAIDAFNIRNRPANDLAVTNIILPANLLFNTKITAIISNFGSMPQNNYDLSYYVNDVLITTETVATIIESEISMEHTFAAPYDFFNNPRMYNIRVEVSLSEDINSSNDTLSMIAESFLDISVFPYLETFDNDMGKLPSGWRNTATSPYNWLVNNGPTLTLGTGPSGDNTTGNGFYVYTKSIGSTWGDTTFLFSRTFDLTGLAKPHLQFFYHMYGSHTGTLDVLVEQENRTTIIKIFTMSGEQHKKSTDSFTSSGRISLESFSNQRIRIQFKGIRGFGFNSDISIDDISIFNIFDNDLEVTTITTPDNFVTGMESITTNIINVGLMPQNNFEVSYFVNNIMISTETISQNLISESILTHTFATQFDFSAINNYNIRVVVSLTGDENSGNDTLTKNVSNVNESPTSLTLSNNSIAENANIGTVAGILSVIDADVEDTHTYTITAVSDMNSFRIGGAGNNELQNAEMFDFEIKSGYTISITATDAGGLTTTQNFTINVANLNEAPTSLTLSNSSIIEKKAIGTVIGILSAMDADAGDTHTYTISSTNAASFSIGGTRDNELQNAEMFDFEIKSGYTISITATDAGGITTTQNFTINVTNLNESPTSLTLSNSSIIEKKAIGTVVGILSAMDADAGDTHTYTISSTNAASFSIGGTRDNELQSAKVFVFNTKSSYAVTITATDAGGLTATRDFTINITLTTGIDNPDNRLVHVYPNPSKGYITIVFDIILKDANWNLYDLSGKALLTKNRYINGLETNVDITHLSDGIYLLKIINTDKQITKQISIVR